jgi:hypothetical protein
MKNALVKLRRNVPVTVSLKVKWVIIEQPFLLYVGGEVFPIGKTPLQETCSTYKLSSGCVVLMQYHAP